MSHIQENAEDVKRQQRQDDRTDHAHDDFLKIPCYTLQSIAVQCRQSQSQCEGKDQCRHDIHQRRDGYGEVGENAVRFADFFERYAHFDERGEHGDTGEVGQEAGEERRAVSDEGGDKQHLSRAFADVGNGYGDQSDDNERDGEVKKFTENSVERNEYSHQRSRKNSANGNPKMIAIMMRGSRPILIFFILIVIC